MTLKEMHKIMKEKGENAYHYKVTITMDIIEWISITNNLYDAAKSQAEKKLLFTSKDTMNYRTKILNAVKNQLETWLNITK